MPSGTHSVEASFNGGAYVVIASNASGAFSGILTGQGQGQGTLTVRLADSPQSSVAIANVGIGDVFVIAGQSNGSGRATNNQVYSGTPKAALLGNDYVWRELVDPTDSNSGQIDSVSSDAAGGSVWPLVATSYLSNQGIPIAFVPCAKGSTSVTAWQPAASHTDRTTLYGSMNYRAQLIGGIKAVLWWQGENDAFASMDTATYQAAFQAFADAVFADLGVKVIPARLQKGNDYNASQQAQIVNAIINVENTAHVGTGPDLSGLTSDSGDHFLLDASVATVAGLWWNAIKAQFGW